MKTLQKPTIMNSPAHSLCIEQIEKLQSKLDASTKAYALLADHRDRLAEALETIADAGESGPLASATWHEAKAIARLALRGGS